MDQKSRLTHKQFFLVCEEMRNREEWFKTNRPTLTAAARHLTNELKFTVSDKHIAEARDMTGVTWEPPTSASGSVAKSSYKLRMDAQDDLIRKVMEDNQRLHSQVDVQRGLIHSLYWQLDAKFPPGYAAPPNPNSRPRIAQQQ